MLNFFWITLTDWRAAPVVRGTQPDNSRLGAIRGGLARRRLLLMQLIRLHLKTRRIMLAKPSNFERFDDLHRLGWQAVLRLSPDGFKFNNPQVKSTCGYGSSFRG